MSKADKLFVNMCREILDNGFSSEGQTVRARWEDGTPAHTIKTFGVVNRYDLSEEFPALTLRPTAIKSAVDEILWIWQKKSNNIKDLKPHIWDEWGLSSNAAPAGAFPVPVADSPALHPPAIALHDPGPRRERFRWLHAGTV